MKKLWIGLLISMLAIPLVMATPIFNKASLNIPITQKDSVTWEPIIDGAKGNVLLSYRYKKINNEMVAVGKAKAIVKHAEPYTDYTLIYYGNEEFNDVYPYATCLTTKKTNKRGNMRTKTVEFNYFPFIDDIAQQKFWVVKSSDLDCEEGKFLEWNPEDYLFERNII